MLFLWFDWFIAIVVWVSQNPRSIMTEPFVSALLAGVREEDPASVVLGFLDFPTSAGALLWFSPHVLTP